MDNKSNTSNGTVGTSGTGGTVGTPGTLYWTEIGGAIKSIHTDGTEQKTVLNVSVPGALLDIALYMPGNKIYWAMYSDSDNKFQIRRAGIDGREEELFYEYSTSPDHGPTAIAIDPESAIIYWNEFKAGPDHNDIWRSELSSAAAVKWENSISKPYTYSICLDTINRKIYFTANYYWYINSAFGFGKLGHVYLGDLDTADTYSSPLFGTGPVDPSMPFLGIAVDGCGGNTYYVSNTATSLSIMKADLSLQNPVEWITSSGFGIQKLALDLEERKIYWTSDNDNSIYRADLDEQNSDIEKFIQLSDKPTGIAIAY